MNHFSVSLDLSDVPGHDHPVIGKMSRLRGKRIQRGLWIVEYSQGPQLLHDHLRASLFIDEHIFIQPISPVRFGTDMRTIDALVNNVAVEDEKAAAGRPMGMVTAGSNPEATLASIA